MCSMSRPMVLGSSVYRVWNILLKRKKEEKCHFFARCNNCPLINFNNIKGTKSLLLFVNTSLLVKLIKNTDNYKDWIEYIDDRPFNDKRYHIDNIKLKDLEQVINSELTSKIKKTSINFNELLIDTSVEELINVITFLKSNNKLKFRQLIDIAGVDYPAEEKRFNLVYLLLSHEKNIRIKVSINFEIGKTRFKISKENDEITINYISSSYVDFTYSCSDRADFENFVGTIFN